MNFKNKFSAVQNDIIQLCLSYAEANVETLFVYLSYEKNEATGDFFFRINENKIKKHKIPGATAEKQKVYLKQINAKILEWVSICKEYKQSMPTEAKIIYNVSDGKLSANYKYDPIRSVSADKSAGNIFDEWFASV
jgi:hypothetical protein